MLWVVVGRRRRPRGKRPGRASGGRPAALHVTDDTARHLRYTSRAKREADVSLSHRCTMEHHDATGVTTPRQTVKASPHRHKWMLSHGAPADPSDPWNSHAAPVSPRQMAFRSRRRRRPFEPLDDHADSAASKPEQVAHAECNELWAALAKLEPGQRDVLIMIGA